tara:strand:- start:2541 stop:2903 length:363 start_codon:yes stop_codon:yes gene_type:complete
MEDKRNYIHNNIEKISDHTNIITIIDQTDTKYTQNNNGIFLNLNTLDNGIIDQIYFLLNNELNFSDITNDDYENITETFDMNIIVKDVSKVKDIVIEPMLNDFSKVQKEIINYSKLYTLK